MTNFNESVFLKELSALGPIERGVFVCLGLAIAAFVAWDVSVDLVQNVSLIHIAIDVFFGVAAASSVLLLGARMGRQRILASELLAKTNREKEDVTEQVVQWQSRAHQLQNGISEEIDERMTQWKLSSAEKEIGLLLLKGLSIREISELRGTSERTVRQQSLAIYAKAGVAGRAELSAYFMEDFLDRKLNEEHPHSLDH